MVFGRLQPDILALLPRCVVKKRQDRQLSKKAGGGQAVVSVTFLLVHFSRTIEIFPRRNQRNLNFFPEPRITGTFFASVASTPLLLSTEFGKLTETSANL